MRTAPRVPLTRRYVSARPEVPTVDMTCTRPGCDYQWTGWDMPSDRIHAHTHPDTRTRWDGTPREPEPCDGCPTCQPIDSARTERTHRSTIMAHDARPDPNGRDNCVTCGQVIRFDQSDLSLPYRYTHVAPADAPGNGPDHGTPAPSQGHGPDGRSTIMAHPGHPFQPDAVR